MSNYYASNVLAGVSKDRGIFFDSNVLVETDALTNYLLHDVHMARVCTCGPNIWIFESWETNAVLVPSRYWLD